ncbi:bifunctional UDP-N-acetylmuramoyl-tripeptide:D-alanyl-D-alanine ligase/alanine racemase [Bacteroidia bacterium]|nr:bifunctional UDP-N-acetylmuramoyl-tripeptide:D-alanyl-D-alanine ligase/alanine racemase [Bacteroidia bacterium]
MKASNKDKDLGKCDIKYLLTDSRKLALPEQTLFCAIKTEKDDGHKYIQNLIERGVTFFVVHDIPKEVNPKQAFFLKVQDPLSTLQAIALYHRQQFHIPVVGITGSNGKTMVKEWLASLLEKHCSVVKSPKSYNSQIGVPLSVWEMNAQHDIAIFEAGISQPDEMERLQKIIQPTIGIFTMIGAAHAEYFTDIKQKISEKLKLFEYVDTLIYCSDHTEIDHQIRSDKHFKAAQLFRWSETKPDADLYITEKKIKAHKTKLTALYKGTSIQITLPFSDAASVENLIHCWAFLLHYGIPNATITQDMQTIRPLDMRLELMEAINGCSIINDSYSSDFNALQIALDFMMQQHQHAKRTVILSDMLQSGRSDAMLYADIAKLLVEKQVSRLIGIGQAISEQASQFPMNKEFFPTTERFLSDFDFDSLHNEIILLKGARVFAFEKISTFLQQRTHETTMSIDLNAMQDNLNYFRAKIRPQTKLMVMVKAFSYGSGSYEISNFLQFNNIDYLTVAYADEGIALRNCGIKTSIMVMNPEEYAFAKILQFQLEPEIYNLRTLMLLVNKINELPDIAHVYIHLKLDTGMHRLGFTQDDFPALLKVLQQCPKIQIRSMFSHLAAADNPAYDDFTRQQIASFDTMSSTLSAQLGYSVLRHILNSVGISRFPEAQYDMVRLGIGLYGVGYDTNEQSHLRNVSTLQATISQIKTIYPGESVGYNRNFIASQTMRVATITIGYADGFRRALGNLRGSVAIHGHLAPVIGNVCMDMCMIDLGDIDAKEGDKVEIFGNTLPIQNVAQWCDTIPYEILTGVSHRVKRIYYN